MWIVDLLKRGPKHDFRGDYFPRKIYYKKDALKLKQEVECKGGEASIWKVVR